MHRQTVVLIETYWNVKYTAPDSASTLPLCINRNILECKDYCFLSTLFRALVLIETYWNVKFSGTAESYIHSCVLIETYWNVKVDGDIWVMIVGNVLIETYWNVKLCLL